MISGKLRWGLGAVATAAVAFLALALAAAAPFPAAAQSNDPIGSSYLTPFPDNDLYRVYVFGDGYGAGMVDALGALLDDESAVEIVNRTDAGAGIARNDGTTWDKLIEQTAGAEQIHAAVILFGVADRQPIRSDKRRLQIGTPEWRDEYGKRVDRVIKALKREGAAVYWLGLPVMRSANAARDAELMNAVFREMAIINAVKFIDTWSGFTDAAGAYSPYGPDLSGKASELRTDDGVFFTGRGYQKLMHFAEQEFRRDLALARAERDVPLAGDEDEQAQVALQRRRAAGEGSSGAGEVAAAGSGSAASSQPATEDYQADSSSIVIGSGASQIKLELPRPTIPGAVVAHILRSSQARTTDIGETIGTDLKIGLTALSSVALAGSSGKARVGLTQSPFYRLLVKGEPAAPKPGRADDFSWPRRTAGGRQPGT